MEVDRWSETREREIWNNWENERSMWLRAGRCMRWWNADAREESSQFQSNFDPFILTHLRRGIVRRKFGRMGESKWSLSKFGLKDGLLELTIYVSLWKYLVYFQEAWRIPSSKMHRDVSKLEHHDCHKVRWRQGVCYRYGEKNKTKTSSLEGFMSSSFPMISKEEWTTLGWLVGSL